MAGDWLKMELELSDKPEVHYIANALQLDPDAVVGKLFRVWAWFNKHTVDGNAHGVTFSLVDRITSVTGFGESMCFAGWLEQKDKTLCMPNFEYHTSESAKQRALTAKRVAKSKANNKKDGNGKGNGISVTNALPREEKRREELKELTPIAESDKSLPASSPAKTDLGAVNGDAVIYIPLVGKDEWGVSKAFAAELADLYPAVDVPQTLREIRGWNLANPKSRKTAAGIKRHINQWCQKEQNRG